MKTLSELKDMNLEELKSELLSVRKEQFNLRLKRVNGNLDKTHLISQTRKTVARIKTMMTEKAGTSND